MLRMVGPPPQFVNAYARRSHSFERRAKCNPPDVESCMMHDHGLGGSLVRHSQAIAAALLADDPLHLAWRELRRGPAMKTQSRENPISLRRKKHNSENFGG